ncbi:MAG: MerR family transcriptional regulator [Pseudomonadota bacterium]
MSRTETKPALTDDRGLLPIRSVSQITGVNPITLRAWERRYDLIRPTRTPAGHRLYSQQDIRTIQRIQELAEGGMGMAQIAALLEQEPREAEPAEPAAVRAEPSVAPSTLLDRVMQAAMALDPAALRAAETTALVWLTPEDYLREVLIESLAQLEARTAWPDRDLGLVWLAEYIKGRADWVADAPGRVDSPVVVVDTVGDPGQPFTAGGLRLFSALHDEHIHVRLMPSGLQESQREQLVRRWAARAWVRISIDDTPVARDGPSSIAGARLFRCRLPPLEPGDGEQAVDFMHRWRRLVEKDIRHCREDVSRVLHGGHSDVRPATRH